MMFRIALFFLFLGLSALCVAETYHFVSIENLAEQRIGKIIIPRIYKKLNKQVTITPLPGKRAHKLAKSGIKDGEIMRIFSYGVENKMLIRVPTPYYHLKTMAYIRKDSGIVINTIDDLKKYRLVKVMGVMHTDKVTAGMKNVHELKSTIQMMNTLRKNRADIALTSSIDGDRVLKMYDIEDIISIEEPLSVLPLFHYIHNTHKNIVPKVDAVINEMKVSGEMQKLINHAKETY